MDATENAPASEAREDDDVVETTPLVLEDMIVEEISIDGMCGVY